MTAKQFIESKGIVSDPDVRFVNAGNTVVIPLVDMLEGYLASQIEISGAPMPITINLPKKKVTKKKKA